MDHTSLSPDTLRMTAEREAEQAAATLRGKEAAARRQAEARAAHSAEVAKRNSDDAAMGIPANWTEPRKAAARKAYADRQRAAQVEAERTANPGQKTNRAATRGWKPARSAIGGLSEGYIGPACGRFGGKK